VIARFSAATLGILRGYVLAAGLAVLSSALAFLYVLAAAGSRATCLGLLGAASHGLGIFAFTTGAFGVAGISAAAILSGSIRLGGAATVFRRFAGVVWSCRRLGLLRWSRRGCLLCAQRQPCGESEDCEYSKQTDFHDEFSSKLWNWVVFRETRPVRISGER
jgi:hypothetical protein